MEIICPRCHYPMHLEILTAESLSLFDPNPRTKTRYHCLNCGHSINTPEIPAMQSPKDTVVEMSDYQPHEVRETMCWRCGHRWIAVHPEKTLLKELECPGCHAQGYAFATGQTLPNDILPEDHREV